MPGGNAIALPTRAAIPVFVASAIKKRRLRGRWLARQPQRGLTRRHRPRTNSCTCRPLFKNDGTCTNSDARLWSRVYADRDPKLKITKDRAVSDCPRSLRGRASSSHHQAFAAIVSISTTHFGLASWLTTTHVDAGMCPGFRYFSRCALTNGNPLGSVE